MVALTVDVPGSDPDLIVAVLPGFQTVAVVKHPQSFGVFVADREVYYTHSEDDADFAAALAYAAAEAARIYRDNA